MARFALVVLDGLGDRPHPDTGNRSPVEAAATPHLDRLASEGSAGFVSVLGPGVAPESDAGVLALLGIDPAKESPGRGILEALGIGLPLTGRDVALRLNFATQDADGRIADARVGRSLSSAEAEELARTLNRADLLGDEAAEAEVRATVGHRGVLRVRSREGPRLSPEISNSDPFYERVGGLGRARKVADPRPLPVRPLTDSDGARRTAELVQRWLDRARPILAGAELNARRAREGRPVANAILLRQAGQLSEQPAPGFFERTGLGGAAVTEMPVERGIARWLGMTDRFVGPMGQDRARALGERAQVARAVLDERPFVYVHLKGPDEPGHDGRALAKKEVIEAIDRSFFGPFLQAIAGTDIRVAVTADHATPCILKAHSDDPVPLLLSGPRGAAPAVPRGWKFGAALPPERSLGVLAGRELLGRWIGTARSPAP
jgi:2,3-bisphosphoglycerate-independent phosphoglycerate mutase